MGVITYMIDLVTIHCTDTENGKSVSLDAIRRDHIARGFKDIGYHAIIQVDGTLEQTRPLNVQGAHVEGHNLRNIGISLGGATKFTEAQFVRLREYLKTLELCSNWKIWNLLCHYEFDTARAQGKTCPNIRASDLMAWYLLVKDSPIEKYLL